MAFQKLSFYNVKAFISACKMNHIGLRNEPFCTLKWFLSQYEAVFNKRQHFYLQETMFAISIVNIFVFLLTIAKSPVLKDTPFFVEIFYFFSQGIGRSRMLTYFRNCLSTHLAPPDRHCLTALHKSYTGQTNTAFANCTVYVGTLHFLAITAKKGCFS